MRVDSKSTVGFRVGSILLFLFGGWALVRRPTRWGVGMGQRRNKTQRSHTPQVQKQAPYVVRWAVDRESPVRSIRFDSLAAAEEKFEQLLTGKCDAALSDTINSKVLKWTPNFYY